MTQSIYGLRKICQTRQRIEGGRGFVTARMAYTTAICMVLLQGCSGQNSEAPTTTQLHTDVIGIEERFLTPTFWINKTNDDTPILSVQKISALNSTAFASADTMVDLRHFPTDLSSDQTVAMLRTVSRVPTTPRYFADGSEVGETDFARYEDSLNLHAIAAANSVRFGLVVKRAHMRTYPTDDAVYKTEIPTNIDRFQENGLFPADAVAILHQSKDGEWLLVQSYNYLAWVRREAIAVGNRDEILEYRDRQSFIVVTGDKVFTTFNPELAAVSELQFDMGTRLPLADRKAVGNNLRGQNPYTSYVVDLPIRDEAGQLRFEPALIARNQDVAPGYLPYTRQNIIRQSFKFLGERYGWGHSFNARDCTGFVSEIYKTFGIYLPRNSGDQGRSSIGDNVRFADTSLENSKSEALQLMDVGDLIYIPGHVMLYLGEVDGHPYVIHDVDSLSYNTPDGEFYSGVLSGVSVTPLLPLRSTQDRSYVDSIASIKKVN